MCSLHVAHRCAPVATTGRGSCLRSAPHAETARPAEQMRLTCWRGGRQPQASGGDCRPDGPVTCKCRQASRSEWMSGWRRARGGASELARPQDSTTAPPWVASSAEGRRAPTPTASGCLAGASWQGAVRTAVGRRRTHTTGAGRWTGKGRQVGIGPAAGRTSSTPRRREHGSRGNMASWQHGRAWGAARSTRGREGRVWARLAVHGGKGVWRRPVTVLDQGQHCQHRQRRLQRQPGPRSRPQGGAPPQLSERSRPVCAHSHRRSEPLGLRRTCRCSFPQLRCPSAAEVTAPPVAISPARPIEWSCAALLEGPLSR